jgi:acetyl-CoA carboxylase carboxyltransferase component
MTTVDDVKAKPARERIRRLVDVGSFIEYGALAEPAPPTLIGEADGIVTGLATVDGRTIAVISFDYSVYGGTQGKVGHAKLDALLERALRHRFPVVIFNEGGGTRAQEMGTLPHDTRTFVLLARVSAVAPVACAVLGRAFAGNANIAGVANFVVATKAAAMGLGGPPLVEAAFGQRLTPEEIGPIDVHAKSGAVDVVVDDDLAAIDVIRRYLGYFTGAAEAVESGPPDAVRDLVPEEPRRAYDMTKVLAAVADKDSLLAIRPKYGASVITALARLGGWPVAIIASQPQVKAGALDGDAADKIAQFIRYADRFNFPLVFLVDTPGFLVGPAIEATNLVRRSAEVLHALAGAKVPILTVLVRKAYGFAAAALGGQPFVPVITLAWPTAEFGAMGFEGASRLLGDAQASKEDHRERAEEMRQQFGAFGMAKTFGLDDVIDPAETRPKLIQALDAVLR